MLVFLALGWLAYVGFLLGALVLVGIIWVLCNLVLWIMDLRPRLTRRKPATIAKPNVRPVRERAEAQVTSDIWPKWTAARREYTDRELALWQEQFDALNSRG